MRKILVIVVAAAGAVLAKRQLDRSKAEQRLWAQVTDTVAPS